MQLITTHVFYQLEHVTLACGFKKSMLVTLPVETGSRMKRLGAVHAT